jgi:hypothetical protein
MNIEISILQVRNGNSEKPWRYSIDNELAVNWLYSDNARLKMNLGNIFHLKRLIQGSKLGLMEYHLDIMFIVCFVTILASVDYFLLHCEGFL